MIPFKNELGFGYKNDDVLFFFGNGSATVDKLKKHFSEFNFLEIRQTHSDIVIEATKTYMEADAHFSRQKNEALLIKTADCMPIMIYCSQTQRVAALHAGWRGVENQITRKTLEVLISSGSTKCDFDIFVGPSIQQNSFEVDRDVFEKLVSPDLTATYYQKSDKYYIDLNAIVFQQISACTDSKARVTFSKIDTKTSLEFHSYRRGKSPSERNLSFVCLLT
ncbi:MAG: polyphenol oxidase family protein [Bdellovibrionaceae bacterium]|nr:polyphenol oxidase family protein [Pseudobdellovibrionaceae bacterium]